jgi:hypothetical protein
MMTLPKTLLTASIVSFVIGLTGPGGDLAWGLLRPMSAVLFILFLVTNFLAKEAAKFDEECKADLASIASLDKLAASKSTSRFAKRTNKSTSFAESMAR